MPQAPDPNARARPTAPLAVRITAWSLCVIVALAVAEVAARFYFPLPDVRNFNRIAYSPLDVSGGMRERPDMGHTPPLLVRVGARPCALRASLEPLRLSRPATGTCRPSHGRRVLFVGDSFVEGFMAADEEAIPRVYERLARAAGADVEVWNLGVGAAGMAEYLRIVQDAVPAFRPDEIVLVLYANDFLALPLFDAAQVKPPRVPEFRNRGFRGSRARPRGSCSACRWRARPQRAVLVLCGGARSVQPVDEHDAALSPRVAPDIADAMRRGQFNPWVVDQLQTFARYLPTPVDADGYLRFLKTYLDAAGVALRVAYIPLSHR